MNDHVQESSGITSLLNDSEVAESEPFQPYSLPQIVTTLPTAGTSEDIVQFLKRPIIMATGKWQTTDATETLLASYSIFSAYVNKSIIWPKLQGFKSIRGDLVVRVQINANKFQQGRLLLGYLQQYNIVYTSFTLQAMTQRPRVEIDAACDTEAIIRIPYVSPVLAYDFRTGQGEVGQWYLAVYMPLKVGTGDADVTYTIYASMENVTLGAPMTPWHAQSGKGSIGSKEAAKMKDGPISDALSKVGKASTVLSRVPLLSSVAAPVGWAADIAASVASIFGFSNPLMREAPVRVIRSIMPYANNSDVADGSQPLALLSSNEVQLLPGSAGTDIDEMSIPYLAGIDTYVGTFTWTHLQHKDDAIANIPMSPRSQVFNTSYSHGGFNYSCGRMGPAGLFSYLFRFWRGDIRVTIKFAKTTFHSGRLVIAFQPGPFSAFTTDDSAYLLREIIDIRECNEYSCTFPFTSVRPYLASEENFGTVRILVLNELRAPDVVQSDVDMAIELSMGENAEFACPHSSVTCVPFLAQSGLPVQTNCEIGSRAHIIASASSNQDALFSSLCIGEKVESLRQLVKRMSTMTFRDSVGSFKTFYVEPFNIEVSDFANAGKWGRDYLTLFGCCFAFSRGGVRLHAVPRDGTTAPTTPFNVLLEMSEPAQVGIQSDNYNYTFENATRCGAIQTYADNTSAVWVSVPQYSMFHQRPNAFGAPSAGESVLYPKYVIAIISNQTGWAPILRRQAAEDYWLGGFIGVPEILFSYAAAP